MATETIEALVEGGKASAAPPLGPALGPLGVNIGEVIGEINNKTASFQGMQVPIKLSVDTDTKEFSVSVGTPPASALIKKEAKLQKGSGRPLAEHVADLAIEQVIKISKMKEGDLHGDSPVARVKEIIGTCNSMGVMVEGMHARDALRSVGKWSKEIEAGKTELSAEEQKKLEEERKQMQAELEQKHAELEKTATKIAEAGKAAGKDTNAIRKELEEAGIPEELIDKHAPKSKAAMPEGVAQPG